MLSTVTLRHDFDVDLVQHAGDDDFICQAAKVSTLGAASMDISGTAGFLRFLMTNRHGSPFEHGYMAFRISAPIFVWREFMRHRIGFSYNEQSGRYMELDSVFYIPPAHRNLIQVGKPGHYTFVPGTDDQHSELINDLVYSYETAWTRYQRQLELGVAKEVARILLPLATYSTAYVSCNPRSMMAFLSLRTKSDISKFPSFPQWEINQVASKMEDQFMEKYPMTWAAFQEAGRVHP